jgi:hypothetical protein
MLRLFAILFASALIFGPSASAFAQQAQNSPADELAPLLKQNRLIGEVARSNPDDLWNLVTKIGVLATNPRDGGTSRTAATPTSMEIAQIQANPALRLAYQSDPAATLALLRATNEELGRARLRQAQDHPRRLALVVGSSGDGVWGKLATTQNDSRLIADALTRQGFEISGSGALIDPDKPQLLDAIRKFAHEIDPNTIAIFYFAGHGIQANGRNFIVPAGAAIPQSAGDFDTNLVALDDLVLGKMEKENPRISILVLDACRDHPALVLHGGASATTRQAAQGLAPMATGSPRGGTMILYSTGPNNVARDSLNGAVDSPFASAFAAAIDDGGEIRDIFDKVGTSVDEATGHLQQPWISYSAMGKFYFSPAPGSSVFRAAGPRGKDPTCPQPGTTVTLIQAGARAAGTYQATDPTDPAVCRVSTSIGEIRTLLFNLYDTKYVVDDTLAREALSDLLSGRKDEVEFVVRAKTRFPFPTYTEIWRRLGQEALLINNHYVETTVFERCIRGPDTMSSQNYTSASINPNEISHKWKIWYEPTSGIISQSELTASDIGSGPSGAPIISVAPF